MGVKTESFFFLIIYVVNHSSIVWGKKDNQKTCKNANSPNEYTEATTSNPEWHVKWDSDGM
jgi:hypothetical protein